MRYRRLEPIEREAVESALREIHTCRSTASSAPCGSGWRTLK